MPVESILLSFYQRKKNLQYKGNGYLQKICRSCKKTDKLREPCFTRQKSKPKFLQGFISPVHFAVAMENTPNPRCQLIHK